MEAWWGLEDISRRLGRRGQLVFLAPSGFGGLVGFGGHFEEFGEAWAIGIICPERFWRLGGVWRHFEEFGEVCAICIICRELFWRSGRHCRSRSAKRGLQVATGVFVFGHGVDPPHTQNWNRGLTGLALGLCVWVWGWVPHPLTRGGSMWTRSYGDANSLYSHTQNSGL